MASAFRTNPWLVYKPKTAAKLRFFCFPYAGGGARSYQLWDTALPAAVEVFAVQYPGREGRFLEEPYSEPLPLVAAIQEAILPFLDRPFAFSGHSMGGILAFEVARNLRRDNGLSPVHLFVTGCGDPQRREERHTSDLSDAELIEELKRFNGAPTELLENSELMRIMLPYIRADFMVCEKYVYMPAAPLSCPITAVGGLQDTELTTERLAGWRHETSGHFSLRMVPGNHFFLHTAQPLILQTIARTLERYFLVA
jgi:surfactin synthase thioesterase subunit